MSRQCLLHWLAKALAYRGKPLASSNNTKQKNKITNTVKTKQTKNKKYNRVENAPNRQAIPKKNIINVSKKIMIKNKIHRSRSVIRSKDQDQHKRSKDLKLNIKDPKI